jgi:hypothetical protein
MSEIGSSTFLCRTSNSCGALSDADFEKLVEAARLYVASKSTLMTLIASASSMIDQGIRAIPDEWRIGILEKIRETLDFALRVSVTGVENEPGKASSETWYKGLTMLTGAVGGAFGLPGVMIEIPFSTGIILRSIADVGRSLGENVDDPEFRATCVEVFAYGGPLEDDDEADLTFLTARLGALKAADLVAQVAVKYASTVIPKVALLSVPVTGAVLGAGLNWAYMGFYQSVARVLFLLKPIERANDRSQVRSCFASIVKEIQSNKAIKGGKRVVPA